MFNEFLKVPFTLLVVLCLVSKHLLHPFYVKSYHAGLYTAGHPLEDADSRTLFAM